jgi:glutamyl-tRNA reductase
MGLSDYLRRFRPAGAPGAAAPAGVPRDAAKELRSELDPVFAALEEAQSEAAARREAARGEAARIAASAGSEVEAVRAAGRRRLAEVHSEVSQDRSRAVDQERQRVLARAATEAAELEATASQRMPALVNRVVETVLQGPTGDPSGRGDP